MLCGKIGSIWKGSAVRVASLPNETDWIPTRSYNRCRLYLLVQAIKVLYLSSGYQKTSIKRRKERKRVVRLGRRMKKTERVAKSESKFACMCFAHDLCGEIDALTKSKEVAGSYLLLHFP